MLRPLVERARTGDREAFDALARHVGDRCMAIAFRILREADRADDAVQAALISAWRQLGALRDPDRSIDRRTRVSTMPVAKRRDATQPPSDVRRSPAAHDTIARVTRIAAAVTRPAHSRHPRSVA